MGVGKEHGENVAVVWGNLLASVEDFSGGRSS